MVLHGRPVWESRTLPVTFIKPLDFSKGFLFIIYYLKSP
jgi:hypothetical protein